MATYYIDPAGNDSTGDGSEGLPWLTISKAHTESSNGDTIYCLDGTYTWVSQFFTKTITVTGSGPSAVIFDGDTVAGVQWGTAVDLTVSEITFQDCLVSTAQKYRKTFGSSTGASRPIYTFSNCIFHDLHAQSDADLAGWGSAPFGNMCQSGLGGQSNLVDFRFTSCIFYDFAPVITGGQLFGFTSTVANPVTLTNCSIYSDTTGLNALAELFHIPHNDTVITIVNSVFQTVESLEFVDGWSGEGTVNATYSCINGFTSTPSGTGVITGDPLYVDPGNDDLRLAKGSPCIDTGTIV